MSQLPYSNIIKHYKQLLLRATNAAKNAGFSRRELEMALFAVCSWIDETVLCTNWSEKAKWLHNPLQLMLFKTTNAGEEFFTRLASLNSNDNHIREVFDYCLALGFKGRYYNLEDSGKLKDIKLSTLKSMTGNTSLKFPKTLFPEAYAWSSQHASKKKSWSTLRTTFFTLMGIFVPVILFVALFIIYRNVLSDMFLTYINSGF